MKLLDKFIVFFLFSFLYCSCKEKRQIETLTLDALSSIRNDNYSLNPSLLSNYLNQIVTSDTDKLISDNYVKQYYKKSRCLLWITRFGVSSKADTVLKYIQKVDQIGFNPNKFFYGRIKSDLHTLRHLQFDNDYNKIERVFARLEYFLTKAYMRYCTGQRYGFCKPSYLLNNLDIDDTDTLKVSYKRLFDIDMREPDSVYYDNALNKILIDSVGGFMSDSQPTGALYALLFRRLRNEMSIHGKQKLLSNIERCRWRLDDTPEFHSKYIIINLPSQNLIAVDKEKKIEMLIGFGSIRNKTPLLASSVKRLDFNPKWIIPRSIIRNEIVQHLGDHDYFERNNYYVQYRKTGEIVDMSDVTREMLLNEDYLVIQREGKDNSLGSVIFRFDNKFSVFMHDTSSRRIFLRRNRSISHGCIRVEKPLELAAFFIDDEDTKTLDKIKYTMEFYKKNNIHTNEINDEVEEFLYDKTKYINTLKLRKQIPLFITYYTLFPDIDGKIKEYNDIYGYDKVIYDFLCGYI